MYYLQNNDTKTNQNAQASKAKKEAYRAPCSQNKKWKHRDRIPTLWKNPFSVAKHEPVVETNSHGPEGRQSNLHDRSGKTGGIPMCVVF